jgi:hypothetical protein
MSSKRSASGSPDDHIKNKQRLSSPEEGEVDNEDTVENGTNPATSRDSDTEHSGRRDESLPLESPTKGGSVGMTSKVPFPFGKKPGFLPARPATPDELLPPTSARSGVKIPFPFKTKSRPDEPENGHNTYRPAMDERRVYDRDRDYDSGTRGRQREYPTHERLNSFAARESNINLKFQLDAGIIMSLLHRLIHTVTETETRTILHSAGRIGIGTAPHP